MTPRVLRGRPPFEAAALLAFLALRAVPGVERVDGDTYARTLRLPGGPARLSLRLHASGVHVEAALSHPADEDVALAAARRICDLDADPAPIAAVLGADPVLAPLVAARPGLRAPGTADGAELLVRAIAGQQVSVAGARTTLGRIAAAHGDPLPDALRGDDGLTRLFPATTRLAQADPAALGMPRARGAAIVAASAACAEGLALAPGADPGATRAALLALPGVGPWTASYVAMRALGDPDAWMPTDLGVRHALAARGADAAAADRWRPYRAYAVHHLWASL